MSISKNNLILYIGILIKEEEDRWHNNKEEMSYRDQSSG